jgi:microcystin-dependent protein
MARREYTSGRPTTLSAPFDIGATTFTIADDGSAATWPTSIDYDFFVTIDAGTAQEERVLCSGRSARVVTVAASGRGVDGTTESNHLAGATVWPSWSATDADESNVHIESTGYASYSKSVHGLGSGDGVVVGTTKEQTLTLKTLTSPKINENVALTATSTELNVLDGIPGTLTSTELGYVDGVTSAIQTQLNTIVNTTIPAVIPVGTIIMYGGTTAPTGWLLCNGQSTTGYTALAAIVGANVPDLMGRAPIGYGTSADAGITARTTIGAKVGTETHTLTQAQTPSLTHEFQIAAGGGDGTTYFKGSSGGYSTSFNYTHGSGQAHPNMQPSTVVNFIIKT